LDRTELQFIATAFAAVLIILMVYVLMLALRERRLRHELDRVRKMVEKK
jgi:hypothetical protein